MNIMITFHPRSGRYVWAHYPPAGQSPRWHNGAAGLDSTKDEIYRLHPDATITVQNP